MDIFITYKFVIYLQELLYSYKTTADIPIHRSSCLAHSFFLSVLHLCATSRTHRHIHRKVKHSTDDVGRERFV